MRVGGGEMVEEVLTPGQQIVADAEILEQSFGRELDHPVGRALCVADFGRVVDPAQIGVNAAGTPGMQRYRLQLIPRIGGQDLRVGEGSMDPLMDGDVVGSILPSTTSVGTLCFGFIFRYSGEKFCRLRKLSGRTSKSAPASVSVT
jgi:hypothetical protein